jgi:hypothetical protein
MQTMIIKLEGDKLVEAVTTTASADRRTVGIEPTIDLVDPSAKEQVIEDLVESIVRRYRRALDKLGRG